MSLLTTTPAAEFYISGETKLFARLVGLFSLPQVGESVAIHNVIGTVVTRTWNLDYAGMPHEQWRCNIYIQPLEKECEV